MAHTSSQPPAQAPGGELVALTGARLIDGTGRAAIQRATLLVRLADIRNTRQIDSCGLRAAD